MTDQYSSYKNISKLRRQYIYTPSTVATHLTVHVYQNVAVYNQLPPISDSTFDTFHSLKMSDKRKANGVYSIYLLCVKFISFWYMLILQISYISKLLTIIFSSQELHMPNAKQCSPNNEFAQQ